MNPLVQLIALLPGFDPDVVTIRLECSDDDAFLVVRSGPFAKQEEFSCVMDDADAGEEAR